METLCPQYIYNISESFIYRIFYEKVIFLVINITENSKKK